MAKRLTDKEAIGCAALIVWGVGVLIGLGIVGVLVWALIKLVLHVTG